MIRKHVEEWYKEYNKKSQSEKDNMVHINCCERVLFSANHVLELSLSDEALKMARGFGGGMKVKSTCGVITGGVMALSKYYYNDVRLNEIIADFINSYEQLYGSISCDILIEKYRDDEIGCQPVVMSAAILLDELIEKYGKRQV